MATNPYKAVLEWIAKDQVEPAMLAQIDYLRAENRILQRQVDGKLKLKDGERRELAELGYQLKEINRSLFEMTVGMVQPDTVLRWHRQFVAEKFDGSRNRKPYQIKRITKEIEQQIVEMALEDKEAGYAKIVGYLEDLGISFSKTTIAKILKKHGIEPAPERTFDTNWTTFIKAHASVMWGCDFFTHEVWTKGGLVTYYILVFIHLGTRKLEIVNVTTNPTVSWTTQQARNFLYDMSDCSQKGSMRYLIHDKGPQFTKEFDQVFTGERNELGQNIKIVKSTCPQMNSNCERVIQSIQRECTDRIIFLGERMLKYALKQYQEHHNEERHHQGLGNLVPFPKGDEAKAKVGAIRCKTRLGGLLRQYYREAA